LQGVAAVAADLLFRFRAKKRKKAAERFSYFALIPSRILGFYIVMIYSSLNGGIYREIQE